MKRREFLKGAGIFAVGAAVGTLNSWGPELISYLQRLAEPRGFIPENGGIHFTENTLQQLEKMKDWFRIEKNGTVIVTDIQTGKKNNYTVDVTRYMPGVKVAWIPDRQVMVVVMYRRDDVKSGDIVTYRVFSIDEAAKKATVIK